MHYQREPIKPEHEYFIDCAVEVDEMTVFAHNVLTLLGDRAVIGGIIDDAGGTTHILRHRQGRCLSLDAYAHEIVRGLPDLAQSAFVAAALRDEPFRLKRIADYIAHFNFEDETVGGAALPFRKIYRCDRLYDPTPRARRKLYAPSAIRRYVQLEDQSVPLARKYAEALRRYPLPDDPRLALIVREILRAQRDSFRAETLAARAQYDADRHANLGLRKVGFDQRARRVIKKSAALAATVLSSAEVGAFARGLPVIIPGRDIALRVKNSRGIVAIGHTALNVQLLTADGHTELAGLCVYFDGTPALDQLAAFALNMNAGEEAALVDVGNLYNVTDEGMRHPIILARQAKARKADPEAAVAFEQLHRRGWGVDTQRLKRAALNRYIDSVGHIYLETVGIQVWGRDYKALRPFHAAIIAQAEEHKQLVAEAA